MATSGRKGPPSPSPTASAQDRDDVIPTRRVSRTRLLETLLGCHFTNLQSMYMWGWKMPSSTSKSRPVARFYPEAPPLRQQRFESRRRSTKRAHGTSPSAAEAEARRRQNTLTQMDFVRLGQVAALEDDDLSYLEFEPEPVVKQEEEQPTRIGQAVQEREETRGEERRVSKKGGSYADKRKSGEVNEEVTRIKREDEPTAISGTGEVSTTIHRSMKRKRNNASRPAQEIVTDSSTKTPLQTRSPNEHIPIDRDQADRGYRARKSPMQRRASPLGDKCEAQTKSPANMKLKSELPQDAEAVGSLPVASSASSRMVQQSKATNDSNSLGRADPNPSRFSDTGMTIPDSEDEGDTQPASVPSPEKPKTSRTPRLPSQKSFSQATTVDVTQPTQKHQLTQLAPSPCKVISSSSGKSTITHEQQSNSFPSFSPCTSDTHLAGGTYAYPVTDSQLLPDSVMGFELPRLPGWSQNSDPVEEEFGEVA